MTQPVECQSDAGTAQMEQLLVEYIRSYSRYYSRPESKTLQRAREQLYQEREMSDLMDRLEALHGPLAGARVLEIGSGSGGRSVAAALRGASVVGLEPSGAGVAASRHRAARYPGIEARFETGVGEQLPLADGSVDLVFSTEVLQHVQDLERTVAETARVLRPGGLCYHEMPNGLHPYEFHYRVFWLPHTPKTLGKLYARVRGKDPRHLDDIRFLYLRSLKTLFRRHGFVDVKELYEEEIRRRHLVPASVKGHRNLRPATLLRRLGLSRFVIRLAIRAGIHARLWVCARKA